MATTCNDLTLPAHPAHPDFWAQTLSTLNTWRQRRNSRAELALWEERDLHDAGITAYDLQSELRKPFWRA